MSILNRNTSAITSILGTVLSGRDALRGIRISPYKCEVGECMACPRCAEVVSVVEYHSSQGKVVRYWSGCVCLGEAAQRADERSALSNRLQADQRVELISDVRNLNAFTFETFNPEKLAGGEKLVKAARRWFDSILPYSVAPSYHDSECPRPCLYFYSAGKGRGKTHLAGAIVNTARNAGKLVAFADEISYIERYWAAPHEEKAKLSDLPGERAWLTVLDDLGQRESTTAGLRDAWYDVLNPRWLRRGWLIVTSNFTPDELLARGTINEASYSRLNQMTRQQLVLFDGADQRLAGGTP
jgi:hypothetical protein